MTSEMNQVLEALDFSRLGFSISILISTLVLAKLLRVFGKRLTQVFPDLKLRLEQVVTFINFILILSGIGLSIFLLFRSKEAAFAIAGSMGLAFAIGAKDIAASLLSGVTVILDRSFQVGDRIRFNDIYGDVISIGVRSTRVRTLDDSIVTIPNSQFMNSPVSSANSGALDMQVEIDFHVDCSTNLSLVKQIAKEATIASRYVYLEKPIQILFKDVVFEKMVYTRVRIKAYVIETVYEKAFESDVTERVHLAFQKKGVLSAGERPIDSKPASP